MRLANLLAVIASVALLPACVAGGGGGGGGVQTDGGQPSGPGGGSGGEGGAGGLPLAQVRVSGACPAPDHEDLGQIELNTLLLTRRFDEPSLTPSSSLRGVPGSVDSVVTPDSFSFSQTPEGAQAGFAEGGFAEQTSDQGRSPVALQPESVAFAHLGDDPASANRRRLIIFLLDSSASLIGADPFGDGAPEIARASDRNDERIAFFLQLLNTLPDEEDDLVSLVWFSDLPVIREETAAPTANRDLMRDALQNVVQFDEGGSTQLVPALSAVLDQIIAANSALQPVVVLFTDGVEEEDALDLTAVTERYRARPDGKVPVIVLDLQPPPASPLPQGRSGKLHALACATGGEYIFLERASDFTSGRDLVDLVGNRLRGAWRLRVRTDLPALGPGDYLLSTVLRATLGEFSVADAMEALPGSADTRLWLRGR